jgi:hypothetical protein
MVAIFRETTGKTHARVLPHLLNMLKSAVAKGIAS